MRFLILFILLISSSFANEVEDLKNLVIHKKLKKYDTLTFLDSSNNEITINDYKVNLI